MFFHSFFPLNFVFSHRKALSLRSGVHRSFWKPALVATGLLAACGQAAAQSEQPDQKTLTERFKAWTVTCVEAETRTCRMTQELVQQKTGQRLSALLVEERAGEGPILTVLTPFGLALSQGLTLAVDDAEMPKAQFLTCLPSGCVVPVPLDDAALEMLRTGNRLTAVGVTATNDKPVRIEFSLQGSAAALARLKDLSTGKATD
ncbi:invasion protein IalB [Labrenzia sp. MBR-25]|jgi:invasion protein IalB